MQAAKRQYKNAKSKPLIQSEEIRGKEGSLDNMLIHGDNKAAMKNLLEQGYGGKIQMIYIDPPYNTGGGLLYEDRFAAPAGRRGRRGGREDGPAREPWNGREGCADGRSAEARWIK